MNNDKNDKAFEAKRVANGLYGGVLHIIGTVLKVIGTILLVMVTTGLIFACIFAVYVKYNLSDELGINLEDYSLNQSSILYYTDKTTGLSYELQTLYNDENRIWVDYEEIPEALVDAVIAIEDKRFETHQGVDWYRTAGAFFNMFLGMRDTFGGSTITQQLIKNVTKNDEVTVKRKLLEIFQALDVEKRYTKDKIMELYLNTIYLGERCYGVRTASVKYFGKDVSELSLAECAALIGITNNPSLYDPYISDTTLEKNKERQGDILDAMWKQEKISKEEYDAAFDQKLVFRDGSDDGKENATSIYSWYVEAVIDEVIGDLSDSMNISLDAAEKLLQTAGYSIYCNIDPDVQEIVDDVYSDYENISYAESKTDQQLQSAIVIMDPYTGKVVAISGGMGEKSGNLLWNRATDTKRQPGSSIKPLTVYAPALEVNAITPYSAIEDSPLYQNYSGSSNGLYPRNDNGYVYSGMVTVMYGVQRSLNTVAVRVVDMITPEISYQFGSESFGLSSFVEERVESDGSVRSDMSLAPMAMGALTDGVSVLEMTAAYSAFPNGGYYNSPSTYSLVLDSKEKVVLDNSPSPTYAVSEVTANYINTLLTNAVNYGTGTSAKFDGMTIAGKTGTTSSNADRWFMGYTPYYCAGVWVGFDIPEEIVVSTNNPAALLWKQVMTRVHEGLENKSFNTVDGLVTVNYCLDCGGLSTEACQLDVRGSRVGTGVYYKDDVPNFKCDCHELVRVCDVTGLLAGDECRHSSHQASLLNIDRSSYSPYLSIGDDAYLIENWRSCGNAVMSDILPDSFIQKIDGSGNVEGWNNVTFGEKTITFGNLGITVSWNDISATDYGITLLDYDIFIGWSGKMVSWGDIDIDEEGNLVTEEPPDEETPTEGETPPDTPTEPETGTGDIPAAETPPRGSAGRQ